MSESTLNFLAFVGLFFIGGILALVIIGICAWIDRVNKAINYIDDMEKHGIDCYTIRKGMKK